MNTQVLDLDLDLDLARSISRDARTDPGSPYAGKFIGILDGRVVVAASSPEEAMRELRRIEPDPARGLLIDAGVDYDTVHEIWR